MTDSTTRDDPDVDDEDQWRFSLDEVGPEGQVTETQSLEPGSPSLENVLFVLLGIALTVWLIWSVAPV